MEASSTAMPAAPAVYAPRLGPAGSACVSLPDQFSRLRRLSFAALRIHSLRSGHGLPKGLPAQAGWSLAAARAPLRRMGCCIVALARGWRWGVGSARHRFCGRIRAAARCRRHRAPARPPRARVYPDPTPVANHSRVTPRRLPPGRRHPRQQKAKPCPVVSVGACFAVRATCPPCCRSARD